jgi:hypothetical protein
MYEESTAPCTQLATQPLNERLSRRWERSKESPWQYAPMGFKLSAAERIKLSHVMRGIKGAPAIYVAFGSTRGSFEILIICEILIISVFSNGNNFNLLTPSISVRFVRLVRLRDINQIKEGTLSLIR